MTGVKYEGTYIGLELLGVGRGDVSITSMAFMRFGVDIEEVLPECLVDICIREFPISSAWQSAGGIWRLTFVGLPTPPQLPQ